MGGWCIILIYLHLLLLILVLLLGLGPVTIEKDYDILNPVTGPVLELRRKYPEIGGWPLLIVPPTLGGYGDRKDFTSCEWDT